MYVEAVYAKLLAHLQIYWAGNPCIHASNLRLSMWQLIADTRHISLCKYYISSKGWQMLLIDCLIDLLYTILHQTINLFTMS